MEAPRSRLRDPRTTLRPGALTYNGRPNVARVRRIAEATTVNIIVSTGIYTWNDLPAFFSVTGPGSHWGGPEIIDDFFVDDIDISNPDNAASVATRCGVDAAAARAAIDDLEIKDALKKSNEQAIAAGAFGSPFIVVDGEPFWGMDRLDQVDRWLETGGW